MQTAIPIAQKERKDRIMKILRIGGILFLAAAAVFFGFHFFFGDSKVDEPTGDTDNQNNQQLQEIAYYRERTEQLETELSLLKEQQYSTSKQYEDRIAELEQLLTNSEEQQPTPPEPTSAIYTYTVSDNTITITGYSGDATTLIIPESLDGLPVVAIGREAFKDSSLREVTIPPTVKTIDWFAFYNSQSLERIVIPQSVTKIEYGVFDGCNKLTISCEKNSYADKYARSYGMRVSN